ncbi:hypothetical protein GEMRC1_004333 [Eukaryota sp. GEM-RC1]
MMETEMSTLKSGLLKSSNSFTSTGTEYCFVNLNNINPKGSSIKCPMKHPPANGRISLAGVKIHKDECFYFSVLPGRKKQLKGFKGNDEFKMKKASPLSHDLSCLKISETRFDNPRYAKLFTKKPLFPVIN